MPSPQTIRPLDMRFLDDLFEMGGGYVLDFTDRTFAEFFRDELHLDIDAPQYAAEGTSKAKRLRFFLRNSPPALVVRTLLALWEYRETLRRRRGQVENIPDAEAEFRGIVQRLGGPAPSVTQPAVPTTSTQHIDTALVQRLQAALLTVDQLAAQARGFAYERFLKELFDANGLAARASFRLTGEQIDGSFELKGETYLLEAKWQAAPVGGSDLHAFNGKVEEKAAWSRGLFVSNSGFSDDGLIAFGRGKRVVCMDGLDLYEMLDRCLSFADVISLKVRRAAETGKPFVRVRDLFP